MRLNRSKLTLTLITLALDIAAIYVSLEVAYKLRFFSFVTDLFPITRGLPPFENYQQALVLIIPLWLYIFFQYDFYKVYFLPFIDEFIRVLRIVSVGIFFLVLITFFYREFSYSRLTFVLFWLVSIVVLFAERELFKLLSKYFLRSLTERENLLIVGKENKMLRAMVKRQFHYQVYYVPDGDVSNIDKIKKMIVDKKIRQVIFVKNEWSEVALLKFYDWCEHHQVELKFVPDLVQLCKGEISIDSSLGIPIFHLKPISLSGFNYFFKRVVDLTLSIIIMSFLFPIFVFLYILIYIDSPGPVIFKQKRMGYRGRSFDFYKFRTMVVNADALLAKLKDKSDRKGPVFKMANDPRITRVGKFLRRYSIDELPQLFNVLKGDMSLVGPRPQVLWEASAYDDWAKKRLRTLSGITGLWQISGRAALSYEEMIELDIYYIENWSCGLDIKILFKTLPAIFSQKGAY